ncbi:hypothetical protein [Streptomyces sp. CA-106131]|uniref:hypothetical protein n=1 Tax=Streptomyces sp. CA-106131 TaxID=3240045 RepID=UPI003D909115
MRFVYWPPRQPTGHRRIRMFDRSGYDIGVLVWRVCRVGSINQISITMQRQGLGRRLIRRALADGPGYAWQTTGQSPEARQFFPAMERETGVAFPESDGVRDHFTAPPGPRLLPTRRRPRPVLERM